MAQEMRYYNKSTSYTIMENCMQHKNGSNNSLETKGIFINMHFKDMFGFWSLKNYFLTCVIFLVTPIQIQANPLNQSYLFCIMKKFHNMACRFFIRIFKTSKPDFS